jgi:hypothetical protein
LRRSILIKNKKIIQNKRNEFLLVIQTRVGLLLKTILLTIVVKFGSVLQVDSKNLD